MKTQYMFVIEYKKLDGVFSIKRVPELGIHPSKRAAKKAFYLFWNPGETVTEKWASDWYDHETYNPYKIMRYEPETS